MLDISEATLLRNQRKNRMGTQPWKGPAASSPMHVSSPSHSQGPQSPAPHQVASNKGSPAQAPQAGAPQDAADSPGRAGEASAGSGLSRMHVPAPAAAPQALQSASANGSTPASMIESKPAEDMPGEWESHYNPLHCILGTLTCSPRGALQGTWCTFQACGHHCYFTVGASLCA